MAQVILYRREMFVWVDETGSDNRNTVRKFGYPIKGQTPQCHRFLVRGKRISVIAAISTGGLVAAEYFHGTVISDTFYDFARGSLIPQMNSFDGSSPNSIIIMDNCKIHHVADVIELFRSVGILVLFLPPYSPDFNPIEETFSYVKYYLKNEHLLQTIPDPSLVYVRSADFADLLLFFLGVGRKHQMRFFFTKHFIHKLFSKSPSSVIHSCFLFKPCPGIMYPKVSFPCSSPLCSSLKFSFRN